MSLIIGCVSLIVVYNPYEEKFIGLQCNKNRGFILPGGKWEPGEKFKQTAARELKEETGLISIHQELLFHSMAEDGSYCYTFLTSVRNEIKKNSHIIDYGSGTVLELTWDDLFTSAYGGYYELLRESYDKHIEERNP